jgi:hypothetical protein
MTRTKSVLEMLVFSPFKHLMWLVSQESFTVFSCCENFILYNGCILWVGVWGSKNGIHYCYRKCKTFVVTVKLGITLPLMFYSGQDSVVGLVTHYRLDGPGIKSWWGGGGQDFHICPERPWVQPSILCNGYGVFLGGKAAGAWCWLPTPSST